MKKQKVSKEFFEWLNNWGNLDSKNKEKIKGLDYEIGYRHAIMDIMENLK